MRALMAAGSAGLFVGAMFGAAWLGGHLAHESQAITQQAANPASLNASNTDASALRIADRFARFDDQGATQDAAPSPALRTTLMDETATAAIADHPVAPRTVSAFKFAGHNQNDTDCLTQAIYYEARGEGTDGMRAVAQVIVNRVRNPNYPKSICAVVYQGASQHGCQFSFACDNISDEPARNAAWRRARSVAEAALNGYVMKGVGSATSFHTVDVHPVWAATMQRVAVIGSHIFYQLRGHNVQLASADAVQPSARPAVTTGANPDDSSRTALLNALSRSQTTAQAAARPVTASAQVDGHAAEQVVTALTGEKPARETAKEAGTKSLPARDTVKPAAPQSVRS